jgi:tryptophanyl-tRNA synthetase
MNVKRIVTGIQPTNDLHIGNYLGVIPNLLEMEKNENYERFLFSADLHALTSTNKVNNFKVLKFFIACLNYKKFHLYIQSDFSQITYLTWLLSCCTPIGFLQKMTQFKSKKHEMINSGYLFYPLLMAADILMIGANLVPAGIDQIQHIELTRDIVKFFYNKYFQLFEEPEIVLSNVVKVNDLQTGQKMSKSSENTLGVLFFGDSKDEILYKIKKAKTDSFAMPTNIEEIKETRKEIYNLCLIYKEITKCSFLDMEREFGDSMVSNFKSKLTDALIDFMIPLNNRMNEISDEFVKENLANSLINEIFNEKVKTINEFLKY